MININNYIIEKLHINKDSTYKPNYVEGIFKILDTPQQEFNKQAEVIKEWIGDYNKYLYCYIHGSKYLEFNEEERTKSNKNYKISINKLDLAGFAKLVNKVSSLMKTLYNDHQSSDILKIEATDYDLMITTSDNVWPIFFEKSK